MRLNAIGPTEHDGSYDATNPQSFNRYAYVLNNPLSLTDSSGLDWNYNPTDGCWDWGYNYTSPDGTEGVGTIDGCGYDAGVYYGGGFYGNPNSGEPGGGVAGATLPANFGPPHVARTSHFNNPIADALFSPQGGAYFSAANTAVNYATIGPALAGGALFGIPAIAGLEYGAGAIGASQATALGTAGIVLGAYNEIPNYVKEASARGMNAFNVNDFLYSILDATGNGWTANQAFLNAGINSGQNFYYSTSPYLSGGPGYLSEVLYLAGRGVPLNPLP